ncbi:hypothetical protein [Paraburkholderia fungorum]|uniref:hypothetical protein n=1 Tax=Paraburkholderia fungorum TaxID=134537 RepID=UPI0011C36179|nr:hypothetical protein [Paraburkholderia fungorum]
MKHAAKLVLCFLIAWLPLTGFAAPVLVCPHVSSSMTGSHTARHHPAMQQTSSPAGATMHPHTAVLTMHQADCHGGMGSLACSLAAIPATPVAILVAPSTPIYASLDATIPPQFIPDLPQRPPQIL